MCSTPQSGAAQCMLRDVVVDAPLDSSLHCCSLIACTHTYLPWPTPHGNACCQGIGTCTIHISCLKRTHGMQALLDAGVNLTRKTCVSDEHYIPSLLAAHGLDAQTDCTGVLTHSDWAWPNWSPKLYSHLEVNSGLVHRQAPAGLWLGPAACAE